LWRAAARTQSGLPSYESVVLGQLGRYADGAAIARTGTDGGIVISWSGRRFESWLGCEIRDLAVASLADDLAQPIRRAMELALRTRAPASAQRNLIRAGALEASQLLAFPLDVRGGGAVVLLFTTGETVRTSLIDAVFQATQHGVLVLSSTRRHDGTLVDFEIVTANESAARMMGRALVELPGRSLNDLVPRLRETDALDHLLHVVRTGERRTFDLDYPGSSGRRDLHLQVEAGAIGDLLAMTLTDVGPVREREASYRLLFESNPVPMWVFEPGSLRFLAVNDAAIEHYGYARDALLRMTLADITAEGVPPEGEPPRREPGPRNEALRRHAKADGTPIDVITYTRDLRYGEAPAVLLAATDVTERRRAEARVAYLAHHDTLTGLPNRRMFRERLAEALAAPEPGRRVEDAGGFGLFCIDLDGFKGVNDTLGHAVGDMLLAEVGARLKGCLRADRDCVARLGGDEFAVLAAHLDPARAAELARRIVETVGRPYAVQGQDIVVGASVGIALAPEDGADPETFLRHADMALYRAKAEGRRRFRFFEYDMDASLQARRHLEHDLRQAVCTDALAIHYQPLVGIDGGTVTVCEALLRWPHPQRGWISPAEFVPLAEEIGLIGALGEWVLERACREAALWPDGVKVAVNLSPMQFRDPEALLRTVTEALDRSGLAPGRLELEITESVLLADSEANVAALRRLKALGLRIAMDDFGTGYSSLSYLHRFPFDKIKIDQSFVRELGVSRHCSAIIQAVTSLGRSLGITTVAEGVETAEQFDLLRQAGCDEAQGYLFAQPMPAGELQAFLGRKAGSGSIPRAA